MFECLFNKFGRMKEESRGKNNKEELRGENEEK